MRLWRREFKERLGERLGEKFGENCGENCGEIVFRMAIQLFSSNLHVIESDIYIVTALRI